VAEIDATISRLSDASPEIRIKAVEILAKTGADAFPALESRLLRAPEAGPGPMWLALDKVKKSDGTPGEDLAKAVAAAGNGAGHRSLALLLAGIRAAEKQANVAGARVLVKLAVDHKGLLKPYAKAALERMGDHAVAALVEARRDADKDLRTFANKTLDAMGKFLPSDAVQVHDPQALADVLVAFGKTKDPDAIRAIVPYLNADRAPVREAARWAIAQYGDGARAALKETYDQYTGDKIGDDWTATKILDALVAAYDKVRLAEVFKLLDEGIAHRDGGRLEEAVASTRCSRGPPPSTDARSSRPPTSSSRARRSPPIARRRGSCTARQRGSPPGRRSPPPSKATSRCSTRASSSIAAWPTRRCS
jgi:hypothetical protein